MTHSDEYQAFVQQLLRDTAQLEKQYKAFEELKHSLEALKAAAPHDPRAARSLENVNALHSTANFQQLCAQAEKDLRTISRQIDALNKQFAQAESTQSVPTAEAEPVVNNAKPETRGRRKRHKPQFV